ncbi:hypothetical protein Lwor_1805 [Legionella worsleiensis]|uniref:DUF4258 domain-containing protein n=1 Tax=Legionella worsleiensis TaxID=45076 RepID=A0A0W1AA20_9GAMM|nr:DUF4258 domain-containing protein [Legionella worsleiensis]KTD77923.1 hypothetical protein Lwor_1805 [Legionella worsleiensis]
MPAKPVKRTDKELFALIEQKIRDKSYAFVPHAQQRMLERQILEIDVINILKGIPDYERSRNKRKDSYEAQYIHEDADDWKYCIEGKTIDDQKIRIIITFAEDLMPIITVINIR